MRPYKIGSGSSANLSFEVQSGSVKSGSGEGVSEEKDQLKNESIVSALPCSMA